MPDSFAQFHTTRWTVVRRVGEADEGARALALEELCSAYWYPLYSFLRRRGSAPEEASDLVQGLFAELLHRESLEGITPEGGRFRSYLLGALKHHASNERRKQQALKRGGGTITLSIDGDEAEARFTAEPADDRSPEKLFEKQWALTILERAMERLGAEQEAKNRADVFAQLRGHLTGDATIGHAEVAASLGLTTGAIKVAIHRLRERFRELLREEVSHTLHRDLDPDDELRDLIAALT